MWSDVSLVPTCNCFPLKVSSSDVIYDLSLSVYRDVRKKNQSVQDFAEFFVTVPSKKFDFAVTF